MNQLPVEILPPILNSTSTNFTFLLCLWASTPRVFAKMNYALTKIKESNRKKENSWIDVLENGKYVARCGCIGYLFRNRLDDNDDYKMFTDSFLYLGQRWLKQQT